MNVFSVYFAMKLSFMVVLIIVYRDIDVYVTLNNQFHSLLSTCISPVIDRNALTASQSALQKFASTG